MSLSKTRLSVAIALCVAASAAQAADPVLPNLVVDHPVVSAPAVPPAIDRSEPALVKVNIEMLERKGRLADGVEYEFWTFGGTVPGPVLRVRQGDTVELALSNAGDSKLPHSIDLHAVTGAHGGGSITQLLPGEQATFRFKALNPGVYIYHCATPVVPQHIANGMYGIIIVEPEAGLPAVDREYVVVQGDFYTQPDPQDKSSHVFDVDRMMDENPSYVVFNGAVGALTGDNALRAEAGDRVRLWFGVGGPNLTSSFHVIGEIFDEVHPEGSTEAVHNVQTTLVPAGGATWVEFTAEVPGSYVLVDHSLTRLLKGGAGILEVSGDPAKTRDIIDALGKTSH